MADDCYHFGVVVHELGHVVGLIHEHQRPDRDLNVLVYEQHIEPNKTAQFEKATQEDTVLLSAYDPYSSMHYPSNAFGQGASNGQRSWTKKTIGVRKDGVSLTPTEQKYGLSENDIYSLNRLYNCSAAL